jgi:hypothetical protein
VKFNLNRASPSWRAGQIEICFIQYRKRFQMLKTFNVFSGLVFLGCAALQWNDPDPLLWIALYLLAAISCALAFANTNAVKFNVGIISAYVVYAVYLFLAEDGVLSWMLDHQFESLTRSMMASAPWIENTREFGGLFIMTLVCVINLFVKRQPADQDLALSEQPANS